MFTVLVAMYGHGMGSSPMKELNGDLLDLCTADSYVHSAPHIMLCVHQFAKRLPGHHRGAPLIRPLMFMV